MYFSVDVVRVFFHEERFVDLVRGHVGQGCCGRGQGDRFRSRNGAVVVFAADRRRSYLFTGKGLVYAPAPSCCGSKTAVMVVHPHEKQPRHVSGRAVSGRVLNKHRFDGRDSDVDPAPDCVHIIGQFPLGERLAAFFHDLFGAHEIELHRSFCSDHVVELRDLLIYNVLHHVRQLGYVFAQILGYRAGYGLNLPSVFAAD